MKARCALFPTDTWNQGTPTVWAYVVNFNHGVLLILLVNVNKSLCCHCYNNHHHHLYGSEVCAQLQL